MTFTAHRHSRRDSAALVARILSGSGFRTRQGSWVSGYSWGRLFVVLDADRHSGLGSWPDDARNVLHPLGEDLATLALYRRDRSLTLSHWQSFGYLHAPRGCAPDLLGVLLAADAGDLEPARLAADAVHPIVATIHAAHGVTAKRAAAVEAVPAVEAAVRHALTEVRERRA